MLGGFPLKLTEVKLKQSQNAYDPIEVTVGRIVTEVKLEQSKNAYDPIDVTLEGIVIEVKLEQL